MNRKVRFIVNILIAFIGWSILAVEFNAVKAQAQDSPPVRVIEFADLGSPGGVGRMVSSDDGQVIAFFLQGERQIAGLPQLPLDPQLIVIDRTNGTIELASRTPNGGFQGFSGSGSFEGPLSISRDGRYVAFVSSATNLDEAASTRGYYTFLYDRVTQQVRALTADQMLTATNRGASGRIDGSAENVVFICQTPAGLPLDGEEVAFCSRRLSDGTVRVIRSGFQRSELNGRRDHFQLSRDGSKIGFIYSGSILTSGAANPFRITQVYVLDVDTGEIELISRAPDGTPGDGFSSGYYFAISDNAEFVAYATSAGNLAPDISPGPKIVITQRSTGLTRLASLISGLGSIAPHLSSDGRRLIYLDYGFPAAGFVRVYDWETDTNRAIAQPVGEPPNDRPCGTGLTFMVPPLEYWQRLAISGDGRTAVFASLASNLFPGDTPLTCDLFAQSLGPVQQPAEPPRPIPGPSVWWLAVLALFVVLGGVIAARRRA